MASKPKPKAPAKSSGGETWDAILKPSSGIPASAVQPLAELRPPSWPSDQLLLSSPHINSLTIRHLSTVLANSELVVLSFIGCDFSDSTAAHFSALLKSLRSLKQLDIVNCKLSPHALSDLCEALCRPTGTAPLQILRLDHNGLGRGGCRTLAQMLKAGYHNLHQLSLEFCSLDDSIEQPLHERFHVCHEQPLPISDTCAVIDALLPAIASSKSLIKLSLRGNALPFNLAPQLFISLGRATQLRHVNLGFTLRSHRLIGNQLSSLSSASPSLQFDATSSHLIRIIPTHQIPSIPNAEFERCQGETLRCNESLVHLLCHTEMSLESLDLSGVEFDEQFVNQLCQAIEREQSALKQRVTEATAPPPLPANPTATSPRPASAVARPSTATKKSKSKKTKKKATPPNLHQNSCTTLLHLELDTAPFPEHLYDLLELNAPKKKKKAKVSKKKVRFDAHQSHSPCSHSFLQ